MNDFNVNMIKPEEQSDKFSWNIYQFIKKHPDCTRVFWHKKNYMNGGIVEFNNRDNVEGASLGWNLFIGRRDKQNFDDIHFSVVTGNRVRNILGNSRERFNLWSLHPIAGWPTGDEFEDVTEWFWDNYIKFGRCLFDKGHNGWWIGDTDRFTYLDENTRQCNWCGQIQNKEIYDIEIKKHWVNKEK